MRDERHQVDFFVSQKLQERIHVSRLGPAYVTDRIIASLLLVSGVVSARAIRARDSEVEFLFVEILSSDVHTNSTDRKDNRALPRNFSGEVNRIAAGCFCSNQNGIDTVSVGTPH